MLVVGVDIETPGLYPKPGDKIHCIAINQKGKITVTQDILSFKTLLEDESIMKVIHNAAFDSFWLKMQYGINVRNIWDSMLCEQIILGDTMPMQATEETRELLSVSLDYTLKRYKLATISKDLQMSFVGMKQGTKLTAEQMDYVKNDVRFLIQLQSLQQLRLQRLGQLEVATILENPLVEVVVDMQARGIGFDKAEWKRIAKESEIKYNDILKRLPLDVDNWGSHIKVKKYFKRKGIPIESLTGIEELEDKYNDKVLSDFIKLRKSVKAVTTYGMSWFQDKVKGATVDPDGRVRAFFKQILNTARFACSHPNLQQLPKSTPHRGAFVPRKGYVFVGCDFTGQELGIMAAGSGEELWIKAMLRGEDIHSLMATLIYKDAWPKAKGKGCTFPKKCKCAGHMVMREDAKTINFAIPYGAGAGKIADTMHKPEKEARELLRKHAMSAPKLHKWLRRNGEFSIKKRLSYSADPFKRRRTIRDPEDWMVKNVGKNNPVQMAGANMTKLAMVSLPHAPFVLQVHDELWLEVKRGEAQKWAKQLKRTMEAAADYITGIKGLIKVDPVIKMSLLK